jgi:hypothetical protein
MAATTFGVQSTKVLSATKSTPAPGFVHSSVRTFTDTYTTAAEVATAIIVIGQVPKGAVFLGGSIETDTTLGTSTLAISSVTLTAAGVATVATAGKYQAAATYTAVDTPTLFGKTAVVGVAAAADDIVGLVVAVATLPTGAKITTTLTYAFN